MSKGDKAELSSDTTIISPLVFRIIKTLNLPSECQCNNDLFINKMNNYNISR